MKNIEYNFKELGAGVYVNKDMSHAIILIRRDDFCEKIELKKALLTKVSYKQLNRTQYVHELEKLPEGYLMGSYNKTKQENE